VLQHVPAFDPLGTLDQDYGQAVIRLAWAIDRGSRERVLLCGAVELLPWEVPAPIVGGERFVEASRRFFVYARDVIVPARRGVTWFEDAARGIALKPDRHGELPNADAPGAPRFTVAAFAAEPSHGSFVTSTTQVPFSADWHPSPRTRHLVTDRSPLSAWTDVELAIALTWLKTELHVDLRLFPEYAGSLHLIAPNPVFRDVFVRHDEDDQKRSILHVGITPRARQPIEGLDLIIEEKRATGIGVLARHTVAQPLMRIALPHYPGEIRERIICSCPDSWTVA
jgi:hypothetical protein